MRISDFLLGSGVFAIVAVGLLAVGGVLVVLIVANRADPDPTGRRPGAVYASATAFLTLFTALFATTAVAAALAQFIGVNGSDFASTTGSGATVLHPVGDAITRQAVIPGIVAFVAGVVWIAHLRVAMRATAGAGFTEPVARVRASYVSAVSFVCIVIVVATLSVIGFDICRLVSPTIFAPDSSGGKDPIYRSLVPVGYLAVAAFLILMLHLRTQPPPFRPRWIGRRPAPAPAAPPLAPPTAARPAAAPVAPAADAPASDATAADATATAAPNDAATLSSDDATEISESPLRRPRSHRAAPDEMDG